MSLLFWRKTRDIAPENSLPVAVTEDTPLPVRPIQDEDDDALRVDVDGLAPNRPSAIYNVTLTSADTEYSRALPSNCKRFGFQCRTSFDVRYAFESSRVATPTAPYSTLKSTGYYDSDLITSDGGPITVYFASATAGVVVEIESWV